MGFGNKNNHNGYKTGKNLPIQATSPVSNNNLFIDLNKLFAQVMHHIL